MLNQSQTFAQTGLKLPQMIPHTWLKGARQWLNEYKIGDVDTAKFLCRLIPSQCPFERRIYLFQREILHIPPLCKLNPLYEEVSQLRFRALCYLADHGGEDIQQFC